MKDQLNSRTGKGCPGPKAGADARQMFSPAPGVTRWVMALVALFSLLGATVPHALAVAPSISGPSALVVREDAASTNIDYTITDSDTPAFAIKSWATSSNLGVVSTNTLKILGIGKTRQLQFAPVANSNGVATVTFFASDGTSTNSKAVTVTVTPVNDVPSFNLSTNSLTILEDANTSTNTAFATSISKGPPNESGQTLTFLLTPQTASDTNKFSTQPAISAAGVLTFKPALNKNGSAIFDVRLKDNGTATNGGVDTSAIQTLTINITAVNDAPVISSVTNIVMNEDSTTNLVVNVADVDTLFSSINSDNTWYVATNSTLIVTTNIVVTKNSTNFTLSITPAADLNGTNLLKIVVDDGASTNNYTTNNIVISVRAVNDAPDATLATNALTVLEDAGAQSVASFITSTSVGTNETGQSVTNYVFTYSPTNAFATKPAISTNTGALTYQTTSNFNGTITLTVKAQDNGGTNFGGVNLSSAKNFTIDVTSINDPPVVSGLSNIVMFEDRVWTNTVVVRDVDTAVSNVTLTATSSATDIIPDVNLVFAGTGTNRTLTITPLANVFTNTPVTITVSADDGESTNNLSTDVTFTVTVQAVNDAPTLTLNGNVTIAEDYGTYTETNFVTATTMGPSNESSQSITNYLVTTTSNAFFTTLPAVSVAGDLSFKVATNKFGSVSVTVKAQDNGGTNSGGVNLSAGQTFTVNVTAVNDPPAMSGLTSITMYEDRASTNSIIIADIDSTISNITLSATSSDVAVVPNANITFSGTGTNRSVRIVPATNANTVSNIVISIVANDGVSTNNLSTNDVTVVVTAVNDAPGFSLAASTVTAEKFAVIQTISNFVSSITKGPTDESNQVVTLSASAATTSLFSVQPSVNTNGTLTFTIANGASGQSLVSIVATDDGGTSNSGVNKSTNTFTLVIPANPFQYLSGDFNGLFYHTNGVAFTNAGFMKFAVNTNGVITSGQVHIAGKHYSITNGAGQFNIDTTTPTTSFTIDRSADSVGDLDVTVILDASNDWTESFTGSVACADWAEDDLLLGDHAFKDTYTYKLDSVDCFDAGYYTVAIPGSSASGVPAGDGIGGLTVTANGTVQFGAILPDGEFANFTNHISIGGTWPLYATLYTNGNGGVLMGWVTHAATSTNDLAGALVWAKNVDGGATDYTNGFSISSALEGAYYSAPSVTQSILGISNGQATFSSGGLLSDITDTFTFPVAPNDDTTGAGALTDLTFAYADGSFGGSFTNASETNLFFGIVIQKADQGRGFFLRNAASPEPGGKVLIQAAP